MSLLTDFSRRVPEYTLPEGEDTLVNFSRRVPARRQRALEVDRELRLERERDVR